MELFEAFDSTMAEILGENEYELLSKQAKVSTTILFGPSASISRRPLQAPSSLLM